MPYQEDEDGLIDVPISMLGGVNLLRDPREIGESELAYCKNAVPVKPGIMSKRLGLGFVTKVNHTNNIGNAIPVAAIQGPANPTISGAFDYIILSLLGTSSLIITAGSLAGQGPVSYNLGASAGTAPYSGNLRPWMFDAGGGVIYILTGMHLYGLSGVDNGGLISVEARSAFPPGAENLGAFGGNTAIYKTPAFNCAPQIIPRVACRYRSRYVWANLGPGYENLLVYSDNFKPQTICVAGTDNPVAAGGRAFQVGNEPIIAVAEIMLTSQGSPSQAALLVLSENHSFIILGEPNQTSDNQANTPFFGSLSVTQTAYKTGCVSPWSVKRTPYGTFWVGPDDVWMMGTGPGSPMRVGSKLRPAIQATPRNNWWQVDAEYANGFYRFTSFDQASSAGTIAGLGDGTILAPPTNQWWLDLREGAPKGDVEAEPHENAMWFGPMVYSDELVTTGDGFGHFTSVTYKGSRPMWADTRPGVTSNLYGVCRGLSSNGLDSGYQNIVQYDIQNEVDYFFDPIDTSTYNPTLYALPQILVDIQSKEFDLDSRRRVKTYTGVDLAVWVDKTARVNVDAILDRGKSVDTQSKVVIADGFETGRDPLDTLPADQPSQGISVRSDPNTRDNCLTFQLRFYDLAGYQIDTDSNKFAFVIETDGGDTLYIATVPSGLYTTVASLLDALVLAMTTVSGTTFTHNQQTTSRSLVAIIATGQNWFPDFNGAFTTPALASLTRALGAMLGYATNNNSLATSEQDSSVPVFTSDAAHFELSEIVAQAFISPRTPS